jgi:hypothetical protein
VVVEKLSSAKILLGTDFCEAYCVTIDFPGDSVHFAVEGISVPLFRGGIKRLVDLPPSVS